MSVLNTSSSVMTRYLKVSFLILSLLIFFTSCRKKAFDEYYGRPDNLAQPIYQQLAAKGNFTSLIACIDKAGYKDILSAAGYWTMFAPNDKAFEKFFADRQIPGIAQLDSGTAKQIVTYCLVYNAFVKSRLSDYQANTGWVANTAFKRRTAYYTGFYDDTTSAGQKVKALAVNRNAGFILGDNNNKHLPYFADRFISSGGLSAADYNYFYPNTTYTGFNVADATVLTPDIVAENGFIHEIDKVLLPLPNIDQYLDANPAYSEFKKLFDKYMVQFVLSQEASNRYKLLTGSSENVFIKSFNPALAFSPNNENYLKLQDNDAQSNGWSMFAPRNDVLLSYLDSVILENYKSPGELREQSLNKLPLQILVDFLNAHMWQTTVWPSKFSSSNNVQSEPAKFDSRTDVIDKKILSNGIFYGTSKVQLANVFTTVYGKPYLDPKYLLMTRLLDISLRYNITIPNIKFTVIMMSDAVLKAYGYDYNALQSQWQYTAPGTSATTVSSAIRDRLQRILATHIVPTPNGELDNLSGSGIVETLNGEYIKFNAGKFISAGSQDSGYVITANATKTASNGRVYYADNLLTFTSRTIGNKIVSLGGASAATSNFYNFSLLLRSSPIFTASTGEITGVSPGVNFTVFVPTNAAMVAATNAGLLPKKTNGTPNFDNTSPAWTLGQRDSVVNFIRNHILNKNTVVPDGKKTGTFETLYKNLNGDPGTVNISSSSNNMDVKDDNGRTAKVTIASSNILADRCVIHLIDNYLQYKAQ